MSNTRLSNETGNAESQPSRGPTIDLQQRTLRVTNIDPNVRKKMLYELFSQAGPVVNVVHKPEFAFIEFEDEDSVGYAMALMSGISLYGCELQMQPKLQNRPEYYRYLDTLKQYEMTVACNPYEWWQRFGSRNHPMPNHLCRGAIQSIPNQQPIQQFVPIPNFANQAQYDFQYNNVPQYPPHQFNHSYESFKHNRYSSPHETYQSRGNQLDNVNGRPFHRYSPYSRPMEDRYRDNRQGHSQHFNERNHRDPYWRQRRSN